MSQNQNSDVESKNDVRELIPLLQQKYGNVYKIHDVKVDNLVPFGENFSANLHKISAKVENINDSKFEELHFVGKSSIMSEKSINWTIIIKKEVHMYTDIMELYAAIEEENDIDEKANIRNIFPRLCGHRLTLDPAKDEADEDSLILLENVKAQGYYVLDKKIGLDFVHATEAMKALAKFHAVGIATKIKYPSRFERIIELADMYGYTMADSAHTMISNCFVESVKKLASHEKYFDRVKKIVDRRAKEHLKFDAVRHDLWSTIAHYDFWTNNIMFHKNESAGTIDGIKFIDFQAYSYADLFTDIYYFMCTSLNDDTMHNHFDDLLDIYYDTFISVLESLKVDVSVYSKEKFNDQLKKDAWFEMLHCAIALSFFTCDADDDNRDAHLTKILTFSVGDKYAKKLEGLLKIYDERGWLNEE